MEKNKKRTLTISSDLKRKIDTSSITSSGKKSYSVDKKKPFRSNKSPNRVNTNFNTNISQDPKKRIL